MLTPSLNERIRGALIGPDNKPLPDAAKVEVLAGDLRALMSAKAAL